MVNTSSTSPARRRARGGFSLLEVSAVMLVLGLIAAIAIPSYLSYQKRAYDAAAGEVLRNVSTTAQSNVVSTDRDGYDAEVLTQAIRNLPSDAAAAAPGVSAAVGFHVVANASNSYGEISIGVKNGGAEHGTAMVSRSGNCVTSEAGLRDTVKVEIRGELGDACRGELAGEPATFEPPGAPDAPDLCASAAGGCDEGDRRVVLRWSPPAATDVASYDVFRHPGACPPSGAGQLLGNVPAATHTLTDTDSLVNDTPNCYWVVAIDHAGNRSDPDRETLTPHDDVAPTAPVLTVNKVDQARSTLLTWTPSVDDFLAGYKIYRSNVVETLLPPATPGAKRPPSTAPAANTFQLVATTTGPGTQYADVGLPANRRYWYYVVGYDTSANVSVPSNVDVGDTISGTDAGPVTLTAAGGVQRVSLSWTAAPDVDGELTSYKVYRDGVLIQTVPKTQLSFVDLGRADNTTYTYKVTSLTSGAIESGGTNAPAKTVAIPTGLGTTPGTNVISLSWSASAGAETYQIDVDGSGTPIISGAATTGVHTGLGNSEAHTYRVRGCVTYATLTCTGWSPAVNGITLPGAAVLTATSGTPNAIPLSWVNPAGVGQSSWQLQYRSPSGGWVNVATGIAGATRTYVHPEAAGVSDGATYIYHVRAQGPTGLWGPWSNEASAASMALPNPVTFTSFNGQIQCPRGWTATNAPGWIGLPVNYPANFCWTVVTNNGGPGSVSVSGSITSPQYSQNYSGAGTWIADNISKASGTNGLDAVFLIANACNEAGCVQSSAYSYSVPKPTRPAMNVTGCIFYHCEVRVVSFFASSMEMLTVGGFYGNGFKYACNNCWLNKGGYGTFTEQARTGNGRWSFHVTPRTYDEPCDRVVCVLKVVTPIATTIYMSGTSWSDVFAPDGWCKPGTDGGPAFGGDGSPSGATCDWNGINT